MDRAFQDNNDSYVVIDGDTIADTQGNRLRIGDIDAREIDKVVKGESGKYEFQRGEIGGDSQTDAVSKVILDGGFTNGS